MMRSGEFRRVPWRGLLTAGAVVLVLSAGLASGAGAATRFVATSGNDSGNTCLASGSPCKTITHALTQAVAGDTISVAAGAYNLTLGETFPLTINNDLTFTGAGAGTTILDATGANQRVITINSGVTAAISGVTITGGAVSCTITLGTFGCDAQGGGLNNLGTLTLMNSTVTGNIASCSISGFGLRCSVEGGGLNNLGTLTLMNSTVTGNIASCTSSGQAAKCYANGGGLYNNFYYPTTQSFLTLTSSTVGGNTASCTASGGGRCFADGGGLYNLSGTMTLTNVTVSGNTGGGLLINNGGGRLLALTNVTVSGNTGGGLLNFSSIDPVTLTNTIIAKQLAGSDCSNSGTLTSNGFNLDSDNTCHLTQPSDKPNVSTPLLGPLQNNGGPTLTHALLPGSPAIDAGTNIGCPATDQRGVTRPQGVTCDIGAYEFGAIVAAVQLNGSAFHTGQTITYQATLIPGFTPTQVDIYLGTVLPDGVTFLSFVQSVPGGISFAFGPSPTPFLANVPLTPTVVPFSYTFTGTEPVVTYFTYAGLAIAGSNPFLPGNQLGLAIQAFQFTP